MANWAWLLAILLVVGLALEAFHLLRALEKRQMGLLQARRKRAEELYQSLDVLARSILQDQVNITECAMRITVLLDSLERIPEPYADVAAIRALAEACAHMPVGEARGRLDSERRQQMDTERTGLEARYRDSVRDAAQRLLTVLPAWRAAAGVAVRSPSSGK